MSVVYFVQSVSGGPIKIGVSRNLPDRMEKLKTHSPERLVVLATCPGGFSLETRIHRHLSDTRLSGEWYEPSDRLTDILERVRTDPASLSPFLDDIERACIEKSRAEAPFYNDRLYALLQRAVEVFGGTDKLASAIGARPADVYKRVYRVAVNGVIRPAFVDYLLIILRHREAGALFVNGLYELFGYEIPPGFDWIGRTPPNPPAPLVLS